MPAAAVGMRHQQSPSTVVKEVPHRTAPICFAGHSSRRVRRVALNACTTYHQEEQNRALPYSHDALLERTCGSPVPGCQK